MSATPVLESQRPEETRAAFANRDESLLPSPRPLSALLDAVPGAEVRGERGIEVSGITYRSSEARRGSLFFCVPSSTAGVNASDAVARGAVAVIAQRFFDLPEPIAQVRVASVREAMGPVAAEFYGRPADRLLLVGVTGTNGKTTTTYLLESIFQAAGLTVGVVGTTGLRIAGRPAAPLVRTTPEAPVLHRLFAEMVDAGVNAVAMEVSSHGLHQRRVGGIRFDCAVFTNLSQDHLDYHGTLEAYFEAKARLFTPEMAKRAVVNHDSPYGSTLVRPDVPVLTFGVAPGADVTATDVEIHPRGLSFVVDGRRVESQLRGAFNVLNCLAAMAAARQVDIDDATIARGIAAVKGVPGRFEAVDAGQPFEVLVDYAHTPDSVENVLRAARTLAGNARVLVVIGCGGDRDRGKRPLMGNAATRLADLAVITSDNPRSEDPRSIIAEIEVGAREGGGTYEIESDRRAAIRLALRAAAPGDIVVIAGKGHETGQRFADRVVPFDDRVVAREELEKLEGDSEPGG